VENNMTLSMATEKTDKADASEQPKRVSRTHRWNPILLDAIEAWIDAQDVAPSEIGFLEAAAKEFLAKRGHWPPKPKKNGGHK
jgi:hypothetical protein